jgi:DNA topoisomerase-1
MSKGLVIVESPAKARTISRILGQGYTVKASWGHVRDLPKRDLGIDVENGFVPKYVIIKGRQKQLREIKEAAKKASAVYLATDPDREGESISWHLVQAAGLEKRPLKRVIFHEITTEAVEKSFRHPRGIDMLLVNAQQARRILDRLVGYKISPILWAKIKRGLSAGRVQSVALRIIVDRERDIEGFVPEEYWSIEVELSKEGASSFWAKLVGVDIGCEAEAERLSAELEKASYTVSAVRQKKTARRPAPPFITSTLQQEAWRKLRFSAKRTMVIAQQLYEGLPVGERGSVGLITYMRTDSTRVSAQALAETRAYIEKQFGPNFLPSAPRHFAKKAKGAQEAHEAIRPTSIEREPELIKPYLNPDQLKLYGLIWSRMVASQMAEAQLQVTTIDIAAKAPAGGEYLLRATSSVILFPGFLVLYSESKDEEEEEAKHPLPQLAVGEELQFLGLEPKQHFTQPPPRYTEATLIKTLEQNGIGRPSTYAPILSTIQERGYVRKSGGHFQPLELGLIVADVLKEHFTEIVDIGFTAQMEQGLDEIARGQREWVPMLQRFYEPFAQTVTRAASAMPKVKNEPTDETCDRCGQPMVIKWGRFGRFLACSGFPKCKNTRPLPEERGEGDENSDRSRTKLKHSGPERPRGLRQQDPGGDQLTAGKQGRGARRRDHSLPIQ